VDRRRLFVMAVPGLAPLVVRELEAVPGMRVTERGWDGRSDLVLFEAAGGEGPAPALGLRTAEDAFVEVGRVEVGRASRSAGADARAVAARLWPRGRVEAALSAWAQVGGPLRAATTFRVVVRVLRERSFLRTELRERLALAVAADRPRWRLADPARLEVWASEYRRGAFVAGLRLSDVRMRQHGGRRAERPGALRPTVAAAMVRLAGTSRTGLELLDPCCGSGTVLAEAAAVSWAVRGFDADPEAVAVARRNVPGAPVEVGDARRLALEDGSMAACVSNLPFGRRHRTQDPPGRWLREVLAEVQRVTVPGARAVLLVPRLPTATVPEHLHLAERVPIRLLGLPSVVWAFDRR
jgi:SAM-dependent methyltransferase